MKPIYKAGSVKAKLLKIFEQNDFLTYADIRDYFDREGRGVNSVDRFKRFLEADGFVIIKRHRSNNCYEYKLVGWKPPEEKPYSPEEKKPQAGQRDTLFPMDVFRSDV